MVGADTGVYLRAIGGEGRWLHVWEREAGCPMVDAHKGHARQKDQWSWRQLFLLLCLRTPSGFLEVFEASSKLTYIHVYTHIYIEEVCRRCEGWGRASGAVYASRFSVCMLGALSVAIAPPGAVSVVDVLPTRLASVYTFYNPDYRYMEWGKYTALREIFWTQQVCRLCLGAYWELWRCVRACVDQREGAYVKCKRTSIRLLKHYQESEGKLSQNNRTRDVTTTDP